MKSARFVLSVWCAALALVAVTSPAARGQDQITPPQDPFPHLGLIKLEEEVAALESNHVLTKGQAQSLQEPLHLAHDKLRAAMPVASLARLQDFQTRTESYAEKGILDGKQASILISGAGVVESTIQTLVTRELVALRPLTCGSRPACSYTALRVHAGATGPPDSMDGTPEHPFDSIQAALRFAEAHDLPCVRLELDLGTYREGAIFITRNVLIVPTAPGLTPTIEGSVQNYGGHLLTIEAVNFRSSPAPGAIVADSNPCASTHVNTVNIFEPEAHGIFQRGGDLTVEDTFIRGTRVVPSDPTTGRAVFLTGGVQVFLSDSPLVGNEGGALTAEGAGTQVYMRGEDEVVFVDLVGFVVRHLRVGDFTLRDNHLHPALLSQIGSGFVPDNSAAIEIRDEALFLGDFLRIVDNDFIGVAALRGGQAHLRYSAVNSTHSVSLPNPSDPSGFSSFGGLNAFVKHASIVLSTFELLDATFIGFESSNGLFFIENGMIAGNAVGANIIATEDLASSDVLSCLLEAGNIFEHNSSAVSSF